jgi:hypothetical protein
MEGYQITHLDVDKLLEMKAVYQRPLNAKDINDYAEHWDIRLCDPVRVAQYPDGRQEIVDGQHRVHAFKKKFGTGQIHAFVAPVANKAEAADWFVKSNTRRRLLSGGDLWIGRREAEDPAALLVEALCREFKLELSSGRTRTSPGILGCRGALLQIVSKYGDGRLRQVLKVIAEAWRNYSFFHKTHWILALSGAFEVWQHDPEFDEATVIAKLKATDPQVILSKADTGGRAPSVPKARDAILAVVG